MGKSKPDWLDEEAIKWRLLPILYTAALIFQSQSEKTSSDAQVLRCRQAVALAAK